MTNSNSDVSGLPMQAFEPQPGCVYSLDTTSHLTGVPRRTLLIYCRMGMIQPQLQPPFGALYFDEHSLYTIRRIEFLRHSFGINLPGIKWTLALLRELERLRRAKSDY